MFLDVSVHAAYIEGELNIIADHLSCILEMNNLSLFDYNALVQKFLTM